MRKVSLCLKALIITAVYALSTVTVDAYPYTTDDKSSTERIEKKSIEVKAKFERKDSMIYSFDRATFNTSLGDTVCTTYEHYEFMLTVLSKGSDGILLHYIPMEAMTDPKVNNTRETMIRLLSYPYLKGFHIEVLLNRNGGKPKIRNWMAVKDKLTNSSKEIFNKLYEQNPNLVEGTKKDSLRSVFNLTNYTEEGIDGLFPEIFTLFTIHGDEYNLGETFEAETDSTAQIKIDVSVGSMGKYGYPDDYNIFCETISHDNENKTEQSDILDYNYFYNGWPRSMQEQHIENNALGKGTIETKIVDWQFHSWNNE